MKIIAPVNCVSEAEEVIGSGADEIYCGIFLGKYARQNGYAAFLNMRGPKGNLKGYDELREVVRFAHHHSVTVSLALNVNGYTQRLYPNIHEQIKQAQKIGVDALIVTDVGLLLTLKKKNIGLDIHMGTAGVSFNSQAVKFYEDLGVSRIVLPRDIRLDEVKKMIKECPSIKFEAIILRSGCRYIDGFCWFSHHLEEIFGVSSVKSRFACQLEYGLSFNGSSRLRSNILPVFRTPFFSDPCGVCRVREFDDMGLYGVKIAGRGHQTKQKLEDVKFVRSVLALLGRRKAGKEDFSALVMKARQRVYGADCNRSCYYP